MSEPLLDFLHAYAHLAECRSGAVSGVVEADLPEPVLLQDGFEVSADPLRVKEIAHRVHEDVLLVLPVVGALAHRLVLCLLLF